MRRKKTDAELKKQSKKLSETNISVKTETNINIKTEWNIKTKTWEQEAEIKNKENEIKRRVLEKIIIVRSLQHDEEQKEIYKFIKRKEDINYANKNMDVPIIYDDDNNDENDIEEFNKLSEKKKIFFIGQKEDYYKYSKKIKRLEEENKQKDDDFNEKNRINENK